RRGQAQAALGPQVLTVSWDAIFQLTATEPPVPETPRRCKVRMPPLLQRRPETLRLTASGAFLLGLLGFGELLRPVESSVRAGAVDLLRRALRCRPERSVVADLVAIAVGRDGPGITPPACLLPVTGRRVAERLGPGLAGLAGGVEDRVGAGLDQLAALGQRFAHVCGDRALRVRDEAGDQPRGLSRAPRSG